MKKGKGLVEVFAYGKHKPRTSADHHHHAKQALESGKAYYRYTTVNCILCVYIYITRMVGTGTARALHTQPKIHDVESLLGVITSRNSVDEKLERYR